LVSILHIIKDEKLFFLVLGLRTDIKSERDLKIKFFLGFYPVRKTSFLDPKNLGVSR
jgi:hypothetical protein